MIYFLIATLIIALDQFTKYLIRDLPLEFEYELIGKFLRIVHVENSGAAFGMFQSGTFILTTGEGTTTERLEIVGTRGRILLEDNQIRLTLLNRDSAGYASEAVTNAREGLHATEHLESFGPQDRAYHPVLQNFADAVLQDTQLIAPGDDGVNTLRLINGAYLSAWQGKIITMPPPDGVYQKMLQEKEKAEESE